MRNGTGCFRGHYWDSTMRVRDPAVTEVYGDSYQLSVSYQLKHSALWLSSRS
jgi:hypothetical protein